MTRRPSARVQVLSVRIPSPSRYPTLSLPVWSLPRRATMVSNRLAVAFHRILDVADDMNSPPCKSTEPIRRARHRPAAELAFSAAELRGAFPRSACNVYLQAKSGTPHMGRSQMASNYLIQRLTPNSRARLLERSQLVELRPRQILTDSHINQANAYFVEEGAISGQAKVADTKFAGFGLIGKAGMIGLASVLGVSQGPFRAIVLCPAKAYRIKCDDLASLMRDDAGVAETLLRFAHVQLVVASQIAACNAFHSAEERLARWVLTACYMTGSPELCVSQGTLGGLLGLRRPTVTTSLRWMREKEILGLQRRKITILDLEQLEGASCRCHKTLRREIRSITPEEELQRQPALLPPGQRPRADVAQATEGSAPSRRLPVSANADPV